MPNITEKFNIVECDGVLSREELEKVLEQFPVNFFLVDKDVDPRISFEKQKKGKMDVYHSARVISLYSPKGKKLACATTTNMDFPFRSDNIMDDNIGLRCCYHPKLSTFGINPEGRSDFDDWDEIEIDIYKYSKEKRYG